MEDQVDHGGLITDHQKDYFKVMLGVIGLIIIGGNLFVMAVMYRYNVQCLTSTAITDLCCDEGRDCCFINPSCWFPNNTPTAPQIPVLAHLSETPLGGLLSVG